MNKKEQMTTIYGLLVDYDYMGLDKVVLFSDKKEREKATNYLMDLQTEVAFRIFDYQVATQIANYDLGETASFQEHKGNGAL